ncbi:MAG: DNA primase [Planctomycetota bacterium]|jgi:DNA primase|nr:DNA primase [Planctomycetota bacterium]
MPYIKETSIRRTQDAADIVQIIESYGVKLRRVGGNYAGLCPFHREKTPSFNVNPQGQYFKCFGCGAAGGVIKFVELIERLDFVEALTNLAQRVGVELEYEKSDYGARSPRPASSGDHKKALYWANKTALNYFRRALAGSPADAYLRGRGFTTDTLKAWQLGWAPDDFHGLLDFIRDELTRQNAGAKFDQAVKFAVEAGVLRRHEEKQNYYDAFRGRVIFPILDARQQPVGFGGRVLEEKPEAGGKYLNTAETPLFKKGRLLFGLNFAAREIGERREAIIVEGYTDTIMCHQYGVRNVVATLGTALTPDHVRLLRRHVGQDGKVVALFDADAAGKKATARAREIFMQEDAPLWILPDLAVKDAAEFLPKFGAEKFREFLNSAQEAFACLLQENLGQNFGNDLSAKTAAVMNVMRVVNLCPNAIRRQMMRQQVALLAAVDENLLPQPEGKREEGRGKREKGRERSLFRNR